MKYIYSLILISTLFMGCKDELQSGSVCSGYVRKETVTDEAVIVVLQKSGTQQAATYLLFRLSESYRSYSSALYWEACNLPIEFQKDGLSVSVTGYKLALSGGAALNTTATPFEIKSIKKR